MELFLRKIIFLIFFCLFSIVFSISEPLTDIIDQTVRTNQWPDAKRRLEIYLKENPYDIEGYVLYAEVLSSMKLYDEAIISIRKALNYEKDSYARSFMYYNIGNYYFMMGVKNTALDMYKKSIELNPAFDSPHKQMGLLYYEEKKYPELLVSWREYVRLTNDQVKKEKISQIIAKIEEELQRLEEERLKREEFIKQIMTEIENVDSSSKTLEDDSKKTEASEEVFEEIDF